MAAKIFFRTFGCKTNQYDSALIGQSIEQAGCTLVGELEQADWVVVNTCAVTRRGEDKARQWVRKVSREHPGTKIAVVGCSVEANAERFSSLDGVRLLLGTEEKFRLGEALSRHDSSLDEQFSELGEAGCQRVYADRPVLEAYPGRARGYVKIQDGCDNRCTYCIVPLVRGPGRSRRAEQVVEEVAGLERAGHSEAVLTGIHIGKYGKDLLDDITLASLVERVLEGTTDIRIRLSSVEVVELDEPLISLVENHPRVCRHLHVPLQHGSNPVLKRMDRHYSAEEFVKAVAAIAGRMPGLGLGSDIIVGFPGETEQDFLTTEELVGSLPFSYLHVFPYSPRPGTAAAEMKDRLPKNVVKQRVARLRQLSAEKSLEFRQGLMGNRLEVIVEREREDKIKQCRAGNYALVYCKGKCPKGKFDLIAHGIHDDGVWAELPEGLREDMR